MWLSKHMYWSGVSRADDDCSCLWCMTTARITVAEALECSCLLEFVRNQGGHATSAEQAQAFCRDYNSRLTAAEALAHPWLLKWCADEEGCTVVNDVVQLRPPRPLPVSPAAGPARHH